MAELSYQDVQRAVQDAIRTLQADMQRLTNDVVAIGQQAQHIDDVQRGLQAMQSELSRHDPRSEQTMQQITRDIQELKVRFEAVERFSRDMSDYFRARAEEEREDQQYRRPGA